MRLVLDSNVYISGLTIEGLTFEVMVATLSEHQVFVSDAILKEVSKALRKKFKQPEGLVQEQIDAIESRTELLEIHGTLQGVSRDPNDDHVLELCEIAKADYLISGDQDLLVLKKHKHTRIVSPREFLELTE